MSENRISILQQNNRDDRPLTSLLGEKGETLAAKYLLQQGIRLVMTNFKVPIGRNSKGVQKTGEIDVIALDGNILCFIEVKTRSSKDFGGPLGAVDSAKQRQIIRTAKVYRKIFGISDKTFRYDVITVLLEDKRRPKIEHIKGFWTEDKFKKQRWTGSDLYF